MRTLGGIIGVISIRFGKSMGSLWGHRGRLYEVWEVYMDPMGIIGGCLYKIWEVNGHQILLMRHAQNVHESLMMIHWKNITFIII